MVDVLLDVCNHFFFTGFLLNQSRLVLCEDSGIVFWLLTISSCTVGDYFYQPYHTWHSEALFIVAYVSVLDRIILK